MSAFLSFVAGNARAADFGPWSFRAVAGPAVGRPAAVNDWMPAVVPGCVHTDLLRAKKIPDPFYGTNEKDLQWIERTDWEYRSSLAADDALMEHERVELAFQGLDTFAEVFVNGHSVLKADNMFRSWRVDVRRQLVKGANEIVVRFRSPIAAVKPAYDKLGYRLPAINDQATEMVSMFARKAPYHYGWDWGPRFVTSGIWRPVRLEGWDASRISDIHVRQLDVSGTVAHLLAEVEVTAAEAGNASVSLDYGVGSAKHADTSR